MSVQFVRHVYIVKSFNKGHPRNVNAWPGLTVHTITWQMKDFKWLKRPVVAMVSRILM